MGFWNGLSSDSEVSLYFFSDQTKWKLVGTCKDNPRANAPQLALSTGCMGSVLWRTSLSVYATASPLMTSI